MSLIAWTTTAISDNYILSDTPSVENKTKQHIRMCRNEFYSASFCVRSNEQIDGLKIHKSWKLYQGSILPEVRIRHVAKWWQSGRNRKPGVPLIVPEMLVNDPTFVAPTSTIKINVFGTGYTDSDELQPIDLPANHTHQYWVTIHTPDDCQPGRYVCEVEIQGSDDKVLNIIKCEIEILPFELPESDIIYSIFYRAHLNIKTPINDKQRMDTKRKSESQYCADLKNMKEHGIKYPTIYEFVNSPNFERAIELRRGMGISVDPLYHMRFDCGLNTYSVNKDNVHTTDLKDREIEYLASIVKCQKLGIKQIYGYTTDETRGGESEAQRPYWDLAHKHGIKIMMTTYWSAPISDVYVEAGNDIDIVIISQGYWAKANLPEYINGWLDGGTKIWRYETNSAQNPYWVRERFGIELVFYGATGSCVFAYQGGGNNWDDFESKGRRCQYTLPALSGPIDTINYEAFTTAVYDARYASLLKRLGGEISLSTRPLDETREQMIDEIMDILY